MLTGRVWPTVERPRRGASFLHQASGVHIYQQGTFAIAPSQVEAREP